MHGGHLQLQEPLTGFLKGWGVLRKAQGAGATQIRTQFLALLRRRREGSARGWASCNPLCCLLFCPVSKPSWPVALNSPR